MESKSGELGLGQIANGATVLGLPSYWARFNEVLLAHQPAGIAPLASYILILTDLAIAMLDSPSSIPPRLDGATGYQRFIDYMGELDTEHHKHHFQLIAVGNGIPADIPRRVKVVNFKRGDMCRYMGLLGLLGICYAAIAGSAPSMSLRHACPPPAKEEQRFPTGCHEFVINHTPQRPQGRARRAPLRRARRMSEFWERSHNGRPLPAGAEVWATVRHS